MYKSRHLTTHDINDNVNLLIAETSLVILCHQRLDNCLTLLHVLVIVGFQTEGEEKIF
jgi:hypothetical protein